MNQSLIVIGVDVGPVPGIGVVEYDSWAKTGPGEGVGGWAVARTTVMQTDPYSLNWLLDRLFNYHDEDYYSYRRILSVERFVVSSRAARSSSAAAGARARNQVGLLESFCNERAITFRQRSASEVKPWATETRLVKAGFKLPKGMPHAADGARHCLFAAVADGGLPDPLSRKVVPGA